jgi:formyltetrahydrofolate-dependent phosphoribosylglycinamide formyltransferase
MAALINAARDPAYPATIALVISDRKEAAGIRLASESGIPTKIVDYRCFAGDRAAHEAEIEAVLQTVNTEVICLAGYMRLLSPSLVELRRDRILNIHPSLLPAFPGLNTHAQALKAGVKLHGCTVHLVTEHMDDGPILAQAAVPVLPGDDEHSLAARVLTQEHTIYPSALASFIVSGLARPAPPHAALVNPLPVPFNPIRSEPMLMKRF